MEKTALWKGFLYESASDTLEYVIKADGNTVYSGYTRRPPDGSNATIDINGAVRNILDARIDLSKDSQSSKSTANVRLETSDGSLLKEGLVFYDWSYDGSWNPTTNTQLSRNIGGYADNMWSFSTLWKETGYTTTRERKTGPVCAQFALYWLNEHGGYDSMPLKGKCFRSRENEVYSLSGKNGRFNMYPNITEIWRISTGIMNASDSEKVYKGLFTSPHIVLHDLVKDTLIPVVLELQSSSLSSYRPGNPSNYTFDLREAETGQRF